MKKVVVYGTTTLSRMLYYEALGAGNFEIAAFTAESEYLDSGTFMELPLVDFRDVEQRYPPSDFDMIAVLTGFQQMRSRAPFYQSAKDKGYVLRNFISPAADVAPDLILGENNIVMSQTHLGVLSKMGDNNIIRQQVYLGHEFNLGSHNVISPGCKIAANCKMGDNCYIGIGAVVIEKTTLADETLVGAGSLILKNTEAYSKNVGNPSKIIGYHLEKGIGMGVRHE